MTNYDVFDSAFDVTMNGKPVFQFMFRVKAFDVQSAISQAKTKGVTAPIVQPTVATN